MFKVKIATIVVLVGGIIFSALTLLLPVPTINDSLRTIVTEETFHSTLAFVTASTTYSLGGGLLLLLGLRGFTAAFRRTYQLICAGLIIQGLGSVWYVYGAIIGTVKDDMFLLIAGVPLTLGIITVFVGYRLYCRLLRIQSILLNPFFLAVGFSILMAVVWFLPHRNGIGVQSETLFDAAHALQVVELVFYLVAAFAAGRIRNTAGKLYARSMTWSMWAMLSAFVPTLVLFIESYVNLPNWLDSDGMSLLFIITNLLTIASAYAFNKIARLATTPKEHDNALLDSVIFLGSLASHPADVDPILDRVRIITAGREPGAPLTAAETTELEDVYRDLEEYLVTKERLRDFDRTQLEQLVEERFNWAPSR